MDKLKLFQQQIFERPDHFFVVIKNVLNGKAIHSRVNSTFLVNYDNDLSKLINSLKDNYDQIIIYPKTKRGNSSVPEGDAAIINFKGQQQPPAAAPQSQPRAVTPQSNGTPDVYGLNGQQIIEGQFAQRENVRLEREVERLTREVAAQRKEKKEYREKYQKLDRKLEMRDITDGQQPGYLDQLIGSIASNPETLPSLLGAFQGLKGNSSQQPAPNPDAGLSTAQKYVVDSARTMPGHIVEEFARIITHYEKGDLSFIENIRKLIVPLKKVADG